MPQGAVGAFSIPASVVSVGEAAFCGSPLTSIGLPDGLQTIVSDAFALVRGQDVVHRAHECGRDAAVHLKPEIHDGQVFVVDYSEEGFDDVARFTWTVGLRT